MKRNHQSKPHNALFRSLPLVLGALGICLTASFTAEGFGISTVGSLPATVDRGEGDPAPIRLDPAFYVRGPQEFFDGHFTNGEAVIEEEGTGQSYDLVEVESGWIRREYRGDVYVELSKELLALGRVEVGVLAGERSPMYFQTSVDGLSSEGQILLTGLALCIPVDQLSPRGVLENRLAIETLQIDRGLGQFSMQESDDKLKVFQDQ